jgi:hypothetical protein
MSADIIMDLHADFAALCAKQLQAAGYAPPIGSNAHIIRAYANVRYRRVPQRPRRVLPAPNCRAAAPFGRCTTGSSQSKRVSLLIA